MRCAQHARYSTNPVCQPYLFHAYNSSSRQVKQVHDVGFGGSLLELGTRGHANRWYTQIMSGRNIVSESLLGIGNAKNFLFKSIAIQNQFSIWTF